MPGSAARVGDSHACPLTDPGPKPHVGGVIAKGIDTVLIDGQPAAVVGSICVCASPTPNTVAMGSGTVYISGMPAARMGDATAHGGAIMQGSPTTIIGG